MAITDTLNTQRETQEQIESAFQARAALENWTTVTAQTHETLQAIMDSGKFNLLPADLKVVLNSWWTILKTARSSIGANADIMAVYNWRP